MDSLEKHVRRRYALIIAIIMEDVYREYVIVKLNSLETIALRKIV